MLNPTICPQCFQANEPARTLCWKCMRSMTEPASEKDYIRIFDLRPSWVRDDLKVAFRRLARKYHPDTNPGNREADSYFKFVNKAYEVLSQMVDEVKPGNTTEDQKQRRAAAVGRPDMSSDELNEKLRAVIRWSNSQNAGPPPRPLSTLQKLTRPFRFLWPFGRRDGKKP